MRYLIFLAALLPLPALAADISVTFTAEEVQTIINDLDIATKSGGLQIAMGALPVVRKLQEAAQTAAHTPAPPPEGFKK